MPIIGNIGDARVHQIKLRAPVASEILRRPEVQLSFYQSDKTSTHPATGRLEIIGTTCSYEMRTGSEINDGRPQSLFRTERCRGSERPNGELLLTVEMRGPGVLGLYTQPVTSHADENNGIYLPAEYETQPGRSMTLLGYFVDDYPHRGFKRVHLLAYMWTGSTAARPIWLAVSGAILLVLFGSLALPRQDAAGQAHALAASGLSVFMIATGLSLMYAIIIPPLQSADEPNFVLSFGAMTDNASFGRDALRWTSALHVERIRGRSAQKFRVRDLDQPSTLPHQFDALPMARRSSGSTVLWASLAAAIGEQPVNRTVALIRGFHAVIFGLSIAIAAVMLILWCPVPHAQLLALPLVLIPAVPSFGMQFSEAALLTAVSVWVGSALIILFIDGPNSHYAGWPLGIGIAGSLLATRSGGPMSALIALVCVARVMLGSRAAPTWVSSAIFWSGFGIGASIFYGFVTPDHLIRLGAMFSQVIPGSAGERAAELSKLPWLFVAVGLIGFIAEMGFARLRLNLSGKLGGRAPRIILRAASAGVILFIVTSFVASLWVTYPFVETIQGDRPAPFSVYLSEVVTTMATLFRWTGHNMLLSTSFFVGFGWLDIIPGSPYFESFILTLLGGAVIALAARLWITVNYRQFIWLATFVTGLGLTLVAYALSAYMILTNLHGRYLIGWFVAAVSVSGTAITIGGRRNEGTSLSWRVDATVGILLASHAFCAYVIARRYF